MDQNREDDDLLVVWHKKNVLDRLGDSKAFERLAVVVFLLDQFVHELVGGLLDVLAVLTLWIMIVQMLVGRRDLGRILHFFGWLE